MIVRLTQVSLVGFAALFVVACGDDGSGGGNNNQDAVCGNGVVEPGEYCDGNDLNGLDCAGLGLEGGTIACGSDCVFDVSGCTGTDDCGNGALEFPEECDANDFGGDTCASLGLGSGSLLCSAACELDVTGCDTTGECGNNAAEGAEECDGDDLDGESCLSLGYYAGTLACAQDCLFDLSTCQGTCGDGNLDTAEGEECDDGTLNSDSEPNACREDCTDPVCGDSVVDDLDGEECDDGNTIDGDGCSFDCLIQTPPACAILSPADGAQLPFSDTWTFTADASDTEDGPLSGTSVTWDSDVIGSLGNGLSVSLVLDPPYQHQITCTATDSDGMTGSHTITVNAYSPVVEIWHPGDGETRSDCPVDIPFVGVADDYEDGDITSSLVWTSNLDGQIGTGNSFNQCLATTGANTVTATATDANSNIGSVAITLNIVP